MPWFCWVGLILVVCAVSFGAGVGFALSALLVGAIALAWLAEASR